MYSEKIGDIKEDITNADLCFVCSTAYTKKLKKKVQCPFCEYHSCSRCYNKYMLSSPQQFINCMNCHKEFTLTTISQSISKSFILGEFLDHKTDVVMDLEKSLIPQTQERIAKQNLTRFVSKKVARYRDILREIIRAREVLSDDPGRKYDDGFDDDAKLLDMMFNNLHNKLDNGEILIYEQKSETKRAMVKCPIDKCNGFLSSTWKCFVCDNFICDKCYAVKKSSTDEEHKCDPNTVKTIKSIINSSKPCPSCGVMISKIEGCNQMWCTACNKPFNWETLEIIRSGVIHNPHYFQYVRNGGNRHEEFNENGGCVYDALPHILLFEKKYANLRNNAIYRNNDQEFYIIDNIYDTINNIHQRVVEPNMLDLDRDILEQRRIAFIEGHLRQEEWRFHIRDMLKNIDINRKKFQINLMFDNMATIIIKKMMTSDNPDECLDELDHLRCYYNYNIYRISEFYGNLFLCITPKWRISPIQKI